MDGNTPRDQGRRRFLSSLAVTAGGATLAGCTGVWNQTGATDVTVHNAAGEAKTVSVTITATDAAAPHTARTLEVEAGGTVDAVNRSKLPTNEEYTVDVAVEDGPQETFDWEEPRVELAPLWVFVDDTENIKFLLQAG